MSHPPAGSPVAEDPREIRVTVAVCTWNRCDLLRETLDQLARASQPPDLDSEILVVNNNCTDATDSVIDEFRARLPLRRVFEARAGVAHARNAALSSATGDYVAFIDDDALADPSWLVELVAAARAFPEAAAIGGIIEPWFPEPPAPDLLESFHWLRMGFCGLNHRREPGPLPDHLVVHGPNMAYRMTALNGLRFDTGLGGTPSSTMGGDERDLLRRLRAAGGAVVWWPAMRVRHYVVPSRMTLDYCLRFAADKGRERVLTGDTPAGPDLLGAPRWMWRRWAMVSLACVTSFALPDGLRAGPELLSGRVDTRSSSRRVRTLIWRKELAFVGGMIGGHRERRQERARGSRGPAPMEPEDSRP